MDLKCNNINKFVILPPGQEVFDQNENFLLKIIIHEQVIKEN